MLWLKRAAVRRAPSLSPSEGAAASAWRALLLPITHPSHALLRGLPQHFAAYYLHKWTTAALPKPVDRDVHRIHSWIGAVYQVCSQRSAAQSQLCCCAWCGS